MADDCIFCKIVKGEVPAEKVCESANFIVIKDAYPKAKGHSLVMPKEHFENFENLSDDLYREFMETTRKGVDYLIEETAMKGYNLIVNNHSVAGQLVPHLHLHIVPRSESDGLNILH